MFCYPTLVFAVFYIKYRSQGKEGEYAETKFIFKRRFTEKGSESTRLCTIHSVQQAVMMPVIVSQICLKQANWNDEQDHEHDESSDLFPQRKSPENGFKSHFRDI